MDDDRENRPANDGGLRRDVFWLKAYAACTTLALAAVALKAFGVYGPAADAGIQRVQRLDVVEPDGRVRLALANVERFDAPDGGRGEGEPPAASPRRVKPAGMHFHDAAGREVGGLGIIDAPGGGGVAALVFDYPGGEAVGMYRQLAPDGRASAGMFINEPPSAVAAGRAAAANRVALQTAGGDAEVALADPEGRPRIRLRVDGRGEASIEILNAAGEAVFRAPEAR